jgi:hypothetical protein
LMVEKPFLRLRERIISRPGHNKRNRGTTL